jgi:large subunit ribosomal protein L29
MKIQEIKELSEKEREEKLNDLREEYFNLKFQLATGKIENPGRLKYMRRDIARILTLKNNQPAVETAQADSEAGDKKADKK